MRHSMLSTISLGSGASVILSQQLIGVQTGREYAFSAYVGYGTIPQISDNQIGD
jgi:hypothetical protein